ncbi:MAG: hypothetical protein AB1938_05440 [Myxococcota bacterium]
MHWRVVLLVLALTGCELINPDPTKPSNKPPPPATKPDIEITWLPSLPGSTYKLVTELSGGRLALDPDTSDALTALGFCTDAVTTCYTPGTFELEACLEAVPDCATEQPWTEENVCCPAACKTAFAAAVTGGEAPNRAFERLFFIEPDCFPGVRAMLEAP